MNTAKTSILSMGVVIAAGCALAGSGCKKPDAKTQVQNELQKLYDEQAAAMEKNDINGAYSHYTPDFVRVGSKGKTFDLRAEKKDMEDVFADPASNKHFAATIQDLSLQNSTLAVTTVTRLISGTLHDGERTGSLVLTAKLRDVWIKGAQGWQIKREKMLSMDATVDGKPVGTH